MNDFICTIYDIYEEFMEFATTLISKIFVGMLLKFTVMILLLWPHFTLKIKIDQEKWQF